MTYHSRSLADHLHVERDHREGPLLEVTDIHLSFGGLKVLRGINFHVSSGELFAIIGPNGAGKTSMFNCLSGVYRPQEGAIQFAGESILGRRPDTIARMGIARTFQNIELFEHLTVLDNLMLGRHMHLNYGVPSAIPFLGKAREEEVRNREIVEDIVDFLEIAEFRKSFVGMLPYGVQKRVEMGRALAMEPRLLLLDEPVAGMNLEETEDTARFILDIGRELGIAIILVEHDMRMVMDLADRVLVMDFGRPVAIGSPAEVQGNPDVIRAYLGEEHEVIGADE